MQRAVRRFKHNGRYLRAGHLFVQTDSIGRVLLDTMGDYFIVDSVDDWKKSMGVFHNIREVGESTKRKYQRRIAQMMAQEKDCDIHNLSAAEEASRPKYVAPPLF